MRRNPRRWLTTLLVLTGLSATVWIGGHALTASAGGWGHGHMGGVGMMGPGMMGNAGMREAVPGHENCHGGMDGMMAMMHGWGVGSEQLPDVTDDNAPRREVTFTLSEWDLQPNEIMARVGEVLVLTIINDGSVAHGFSVPGLGVSIPVIAPGDSRTVEIPVRKGSYEAYCPIPGHRQLGQSAEVVVE